MDLLNNLKLLLDLTDSDSELDVKLNLIIEQSKKKVLAYLPNVTLVPDELSYIVLELSVVLVSTIKKESFVSSPAFNTPLRILTSPPIKTRRPQIPITILFIYRFLSKSN